MDVNQIDRTAAPSVLPGMTPVQRKSYMTQLPGVIGFHKEGWPLVQMVVDDDFVNWWRYMRGTLHCPFFGPGRIIRVSRDYYATRNTVDAYERTRIPGTAYMYLYYRED